MPPKAEDWVDLCRRNKMLLSPRCCVSIGGDVFCYVGYFLPNRAASLWLMNFYGGIEFMSIVREVRS